MSVRGQEEQYTYDFCDANHPTEVLDALRGFYRDGVFTDIALQGSTGRILHCHKVALCARSSYFRVMFTADMRERSNSLIRLPGVEEEVLSALVDYTYSSRLAITQGNVESLLEAADLLHFLSVKRACEDFLVRLLDASNCLGMLAFSQLHVCPALEREARRLLLSHFQEVAREEEFLELDSDRLSSVLGAKSPGPPPREEELAEAVTNWVGHDADDRLELLPSLLRSLDLQLELAAGETRLLPLTGARNQRTSLESELELGESCVRAALGLERRPDRDLQPTGREGGLPSIFTQALKPLVRAGRPRSPPGGRCRRLSPRMAIVGGYHWHPLAEVRLWDPDTGVWEQGAGMPDPGRESYGACLLGGKVYVSGGYSTDTTEALDSVWVYDSDRDRWHEGQPMLGARFYHCSVALQGCVFAMGGYRGGAPMADAEQYDPLKRKWLPLASMAQGVGNATAAVHRDTIYVAGGHYGYKGSCTYDKIQSYRADLNEWSVVATCPRPEYGVSLVSLGPLLYLVGGRTPQADSYDPQGGAWRQLSPAQERRLEAGAAVLGGFLYLTGGYSCSRGSYLGSVERYDPRRDAWETVASLPEPTRSHGCLCVYTV